MLDPDAFPSGGGGVIGTAPDLLRFLKAIRDGGLLKPATVAGMIRDRSGPHAMTQGAGWGFGIGWAVLDDPALAHTPQGKDTIQWGGAYGHIWFVDPKAMLTLVLLINTTPEGMSGAITTDVRDAVYAR